MNQPDEVIEYGMIEREVRPIHEQQLLSTGRERSEQGTEGHIMSIDGDDHTEVEPISVIGFDGGHDERWWPGELAVVGPLALDDDAHRFVVLDRGQLSGDEFGSGHPLEAHAVRQVLDIDDACDAPFDGGLCAVHRIRGLRVRPEHGCRLHLVLPMPGDVEPVSYPE